MFGDRVHGSGGFVEDQDRLGLMQSAGEEKALPLTSGEFLSLLTYLGEVAVGRCVNTSSSADDVIADESTFGAARLSKTVPVNTVPS